MPRSFSNQESRQIRDSLMQKGKDLFSLQGLRKTTLDDLVQAAGIAKGSFYKFFPSKEILYMEILEEEERQLRSSLKLKHVQGETLTREGIKSFFMGFISYMDKNPLFIKMFQEQALELLMRKLPPEIVENHMKNDDTWFQEVFADWQSSGYLIAMKPEVFAALMRGIFILFTQKEIIGKQHFEGALSFLFDSLSGEIMRSKETK
ncbi:TetR/AcrR family transcriptional regulator [Oceanispirochaeta sp.]|uniref:TetR/AcrR family transcriptional regulator n=1 Tax=Oceanispirochaeta sp. TaxID=2035350 RepID=UPI0026188909|nr:TetR/AcrR family transcriptional regulator [Oceanispirochaeta sp.]MDA3955419.1 TetR/AcrR family transcriptional regulator [Oceanispirochaeta sp.]